ncbi:MAG TPA: hypothetical protein PK514_09420 [Spirochaetota bacterium]|nr:hypothetical protein [Spirochaetota bacterium]
MEVRINDYPVEIMLENEKNAKEVVKSITEWINEKNLIFLGVDIDGNYHDAEEVPPVPVENITMMNCLVQSRADVVYETVNEGIAYCDRVLGFLQHTGDEGIDADELGDLISGMEWLQEVFSTIAGLLKMDLGKISFRDEKVSAYIEKLAALKHKIVTFMSEMKDQDDIDIEENIFYSLREIFGVFLVSEEMKRLIIDSIDSPDVLLQSLKEVKEMLPQQLELLEQIAAAYQTGNDPEGVDKLFRFIDFLFTYTRTCYQVSPVFGVDLKEILIDGISLEEKNRELQTLMNETMDIMESNDMISLADILEYEIKESLENIDKYIDLLLEQV